MSSAYDFYKATEMRRDAYFSQIECTNLQQLFPFTLEEIQIQFNLFHASQAGCIAKDGRYVYILDEPEHLKSTRDIKLENGDLFVPHDVQYWSPRFRICEVLDGMAVPEAEQRDLVAKIFEMIGSIAEKHMFKFHHLQINILWIISRLHRVEDLDIFECMCATEDEHGDRFIRESMETLSYDGGVGDHGEEDELQDYFDNDTVVESSPARYDSLDKESTNLGLSDSDSEGNVDSDSQEDSNSDDDDEDEDEDDDSDDNEQEDNDVVETSPASESAIAELMKMRHESWEDDRTCVICLEEVGRVATRLPCLHLYHEACIGKWLSIKHMCPKCRYPMPSVTNQCSFWRFCLSFFLGRFFNYRMYTIY